jgi:8-oxo-dGTP pyrophosphatase MutT (NUDIX family)
MKFKNRPNQCVWISRSVAVLAVVFFRHQNRTFVPLGKRSVHCPTGVGKYGLVAGYLDWDESASEAVIREVWEELGIDLRELGKPVAGDLNQPYYVFSDPNEDAAQNVTLRFLCVFEVEQLPQLKPSPEVESAEWVAVDKAISMDLAFNHAEIIKETSGICWQVALDKI